MGITHQLCWPPTPHQPAPSPPAFAPRPAPFPSSQPTRPPTPAAHSSIPSPRLHASCGHNQQLLWEHMLCKWAEDLPRTETERGRMAGQRMMLLGEQTWPNSLQTSSTGTRGWARGRPASTTTCRCCPPRGGRKHSHHGYTGNSQGLRILQTPACLCPRITDLGIESWAFAALIRSAVHVVWAGSRPV